MCFYCFWSLVIIEFVFAFIRFVRLLFVCLFFWFSCVCFELRLNVVFLCFFKSSSTASTCSVQMNVRSRAALRRVLCCRLIVIVYVMQCFFSRIINRLIQIIHAKLRLEMCK